MTNRFENAHICVNGASNERRVASSLVEAIDECRAENVDPRCDAAVTLILDQLTQLLGGPITTERFAKAFNIVMDKVEQRA